MRLVEQIAERLQPDLILYAGDDVRRFEAGPNSWSPLAQRTPLGLAGVIGNDCTAADVEVFQQPGCHNLHRVPLLLDGLAILGLQGAPRDECQPIGATLYTKRAARTHLDHQIALAGRRKIILVSHCPPHGVLDEAMRFGVDNVGSTVVREFLRQPRVRAVVCGHVHLHGGRVETIRQCSVVNIASHDHASARLRYALLEWDGRSVKTTLGCEKDHRLLAALPGIGGARATRFERAGFLSTADILDAEDGALATVCSSADVARRLRASARAYMTGQAVLLGNECGFPEDSVIVDVETSLAQNDPWLIGFKLFAAPRLHQLEELDARRHECHLRRLGREIMRLQPQTLIQWGPFDRGALARAHQSVGLDEATWLDPKRWMDASRWVQRVVALPLPDVKLKTVARHFGYRYRVDGLDGLTVGLWYSKYRQLGTRFDVRMVRSYNRDDVRAVEFIMRAVQELAATSETLVEPPVQFSKIRRRAA